MKCMICPDEGTRRIEITGATVDHEGRSSGEIRIDVATYLCPEHYECFCFRSGLVLGTLDKSKEDVFSAFRAPASYLTVQSASKEVLLAEIARRASILGPLFGEKTPAALAVKTAYQAYLAEFNNGALSVEYFLDFVAAQLDSHRAVRLQVWLEESQLAQLDAMCERENISRTELIGSSIDAKWAGRAQP
jgi:hypothetical protein